MTITVEVANTSGLEIDVDDAGRLVRQVLEHRGPLHGEVGLLFVTPGEIRALKRQHLGIDEVTDVLSFPIDGIEELPEGLPRHIGDVVVCPSYVKGDWRPALVHGCLHLLGLSHDQMGSLEKGWT